MFCRRISSCILLVIIVLSVTRTPIIASAAEASATNDNIPLNKWEQLSLMKNHLEKTISHAHLKNTISTDLQRLIDSHGNSNNLPSIIESLCSVLQFEELNGYQKKTIIAMIKLLVECHASSDNAASIIHSLCYLSHFCQTLNKLDCSQIDIIIAQIHLLIDKLLSSDNAPLIIESLCNVLKNRRLDDKIIKLIDLLVKRHGNSDNSPLIIDTLCSVLNFPHTYGICSLHFKNTIIAIILSLVDKHGNADNLRSFIRSLSPVFLLGNLDPPQRIKIIFTIDSLVNKHGNADNLQWINKILSRCLECEKNQGFAGPFEMISDNSMFTQASIYQIHTIKRDAE